jgi:hypothetical protein
MCMQGYLYQSFILIILLYEFNFTWLILYWKALWHIWGKPAVPWFTSAIVDIKCCMELNVIVRCNVQQNKLFLVREGNFT